MFQGHPKGLYVAFVTNMGERFGFYTMMAILVMFLQAKYNMEPNEAGDVYSNFYFGVYGAALIGGLLADYTQSYQKVIAAGVVIMTAGYSILAVPTLGYWGTIGGLAIIALGNGLFKGNLQAVVGQLYDDPAYSKVRDTAFSIFYMGINIGAFFAPNAASSIRSWYLERNGFTYDADVPALCNLLLSNKLPDTSKLQALANQVSGKEVSDLSAFAQQYLGVFARGYHWAFAVAGVAMLVSLLSYVLFRHHLPNRQKDANAGQSTTAMEPAEERKRLGALVMVFLVVIFFWMSFHQNGLTMTFFARDYTVKTVDPLTNLLFDLPALLAIIACGFGIYFTLKPGSTGANKAQGIALAVAGAAVAFWRFNGFTSSNPIDPETFQQFNPVFIVTLTPVVVGVFAWLREKNSEPSTPRKIGFGMFLAAVGFGIMTMSSFGLMSPESLGGQPSPDRVSAYWLISTYFVLTFAELLLSPMGLSFVSKVAPPRLQGSMQAGWLLATAAGNKLVKVGSSLWPAIEVWQVWLLFAGSCLVSGTIMFLLVRRLEAATGGK